MSNEIMSSEIVKYPSFLTNEQCEILNQHSGIILLKMLKGRLLNVVEGCGLNEKQEEAVKRTITDYLYQAQKDLSKEVYDLRI